MPQLEERITNILSQHLIMSKDPLIVGNVIDDILDPFDKAATLRIIYNNKKKEVTTWAKGRDSRARHEDTLHISRVKASYTCWLLLQLTTQDFFTLCDKGGSSELCAWFRKRKSQRHEKLVVVWQSCSCLKTIQLIDRKYLFVPYWIFWYIFFEL